MHDELSGDRARILYGFFKSVHPTLARLTLFCSLADVTIEVVNLQHLHVPPAIADDGRATGSVY